MSMRQVLYHKDGWSYSCACRLQRGCHWSSGTLLILVCTLAPATNCTVCALLKHVNLVCHTSCIHAVCQHVRCLEWQRARPRWNKAQAAYLGCLPAPPCNRAALPGMHTTFQVALIYKWRASATAAQEPNKLLGKVHGV